MSAFFVDGNSTIACQRSISIQFERLLRLRSPGPAEGMGSPVGGGSVFGSGSGRGGGQYIRPLFWA